jgi:myo-inositol-1(or 4)-monophosphatase
LLALAVELCRAAGRLVEEGAGRARHTVDTKSTRTDMVTEVDRASERLVVDRLRQVRPGDAILGEEGTAAAGTTGVQWFIDPIDGTTNFLYGFPSYAVSVGCEVDGVPTAGAVYDPVHREMFTACTGGGAFLDGHRLSVDGAAPDLATALVGTGFSYDAAGRRRQAEELAYVLPSVRDIRRAGSAASDMCWAAAGRLDAYYERGVQPWDVAAGVVIATEAGLLVGRLDDGTIVTAPPHLFEPLCELLNLAQSRARSRGPGE